MRLSFCGGAGEKCVGALDSAAPMPLRSSGYPGRHMPHPIRPRHFHAESSDLAGHPAPDAERVTFSYFDVAGEPFHQQLLAWRGRVGHVMDVLPLRDQLAQPFRGAIARYDAGGIAFTDCVTDTLQIERTIARISRDSVRSFAFHIFLSGGTGILSGRRGAPTPPWPTASSGSIWTSPCA